jgi:hypothetical protein
VPRHIGLSQSQSQSNFTTDGQSVSMSWCRAQFGTFDQRYYFFFFESCSLILAKEVQAEVRSLVLSNGKGPLPDTMTGRVGMPH